MKNELLVSSKTKSLTMCSILAAISIFMTYTPFGMIPFLIFSVSISHMPTIIASLMMGPVQGAIVGAFFGATTMSKAFIMPGGILDPLFMNPLISVVPRIFIGITPYYVAKLIKNENMRIILGAAVGSMTNTILVLGMIWLIYAKKVYELTQGTTAAQIFISVLTSAGIIEMVTATALTFVVVKGLRRAFRLDKERMK